MKTRSLCTSSVIAVALLIFAWQIIFAEAAARSVSPGDRLSIEQPSYTGEWKGYDLTVEYRYSTNQGQMDLSGWIRFSNSLVLGYSRVEDFRLGAIFLDGNGRVLKEIGLATNRGSFDPLPFHRKINLPPNTVSMAFSYQGKAIESGMEGSPTSFWFSPVQ